MNIFKLLTNKLIISSSFILIAASANAVNHVDGKTAYEDITATAIPMIGANKTIIGQEFKFPSGAPLIKAFNIEIAPGKKTDIHQHLVPLYVYVVSGELEVDYGSKGKKVIPAGSSYVEAMNWCHYGKSSGKGPVSVIGVYLGQEKPDQIKPETCDKLQ